MTRLAVGVALLILAVLVGAAGSDSAGLTPLSVESLPGAPNGTSLNHPKLLNALEARQLRAGDEDRVPAFGAPPSPVAASQPTPAVAGSATPGASVRETITGTASWHATGRDGMFAAAGPALRVGDWRGSVVTVCAGRCVTVTLNDFCRCVVDGRERLLDLSDESFKAICGDLSRGLCEVTVE